MNRVVLHRTIVPLYAWILLVISVGLGYAQGTHAIPAQGNHASEIQTMKGKGADREMNGPRIFTREDDGKEFTLSCGEGFRVELSESPTTGYVWSVSETLSPQVTLLDRRFEPSGEDAQRMGGGGIRIFTFEAYAAGIVTMELCLRRPWEKEGTCIETFSLSLIIERGTSP